MSSLFDQVPVSTMTVHEESAMHIDQQQEEEREEEDAFLRFIDYARSELWPGGKQCGGEEQPKGPGWSWIVTRILKTCIAYSSGVTSAIILSDLFQAWNEMHRNGALKKQLECVSQLKKKHKRAKLPNTVTIDSIYEKKFLSLNAVIEAVIIDAFLLPGTDIYMLSLGDFWSSNTIDLYLHRRFYNLADPKNGILKKEREVLLTGCYLRTASGGSRYPRLLPTEYLVILLDEDQDDDAMLLGAEFCSDSFSSISLDAFNKGISYSLYARIEAIGQLEIQGKYGSLQRKQIALVDNDGIRLEFLLWGEQVQLANLFSVGSMLALERPFVANFVDSGLETSEGISLEYGSATKLYLVPFLQHEEQVCVALTQNQYSGSRLLSALEPSQGPIFSQVTLPCDPQGSINFSNYPFRSFVVDIHDKMSSISLYGVVTDITRERDTSDAIFSLRIEDTTGAVWAKLHFSRSWSLGRLGLGHTVYITGLTCSVTKKKPVQVLWYEGDAGASSINISCLPALLNSSCLHQLSHLADLSVWNRSTHVCGFLLFLLKNFQHQPIFPFLHSFFNPPLLYPGGVILSILIFIQICRVWLDQIDHCHVNTRFSHTLCGNFVNKEPGGFFSCSFCHCSCNTEVVRTFHLNVTLADETSKVFAWSTGQTATELLQISPDEFYELPEEEQIMYPSSLEHESFIVAIVNCRSQSYALVGQDHETVKWEITCALKCD